MEVSCGLLIINEKNELLLCEVTGGKGRHDIPKGLKEDNESPRHAALRECKEETGFDFSDKELQDLGEHSYLAGKRLHLFKANINSSTINLKDFKCTSFFELKIKEGIVKKMPEVLNAKWIEKDAIQGKVSKTLYSVILPYLN